MPTISFPVWSVGRRKTSIARVRLAPGQGKTLINSQKSVEQYFGGHLRAKWIAMRPFDVAKVGTKYDLWIDVAGGGVNGQAEAISHGLARAFAQLDHGVRVAMRKEGLLTRDDRMVERKKPGQPKARKRFQYSKR